MLRYYTFVLYDSVYLGINTNTQNASYLRVSATTIINTGHYTLWYVCDTYTGMFLLNYKNKKKKN